MARIIKLANGVTMPALGFGTWLSAPGVVGESVKTALQLGYKHVDCAARYQNEKEIGAALASFFANSGANRSEIFITGKLWVQDVTRAREACEKSLKDLQVDYLDQYLVHHPYEIHADCQTFFPENDNDKVGYSPDRFQEIWQSMESLYKSGMVKSIGVCNFTKHKVSEILKRSPEIRPHVVQNELHPHLPQWDQFNYLLKEGITPAGFSSLGNPERPPQMQESGDTTLLEDPSITSIAKKHNCSNAQILLAWGMNRGAVVLTKSIREHEIKDSIQSLDVTLDDQDMETINNIKTRCRYLKHRWFIKPGQTLEDVWDNEVLG